MEQRNLINSRNKINYHHYESKEFRIQTDVVLLILILILTTVIFGLVISIPKTQDKFTNSNLKNIRTEKSSENLNQKIVQIDQKIEIKRISFQETIHNQNLKRNQTPIMTAQRAQNHERFYARLTIAHPYPWRNV